MGFSVRTTQVHAISDISPHMRRVVLSGPELEGFPENHEGAHVKIVLPKPNEEIPNFGFSLGLKKRMRSYTVRYFDSTQNRLTIDFAVNDHQGLAANWALNAEIGDYLGIAGPGDTKHTDYHADWHLMVADLTAMPALAASLEKMPENAQGYIVVQVPSEDDKQALRVPEGMKIQWIISRDPARKALLSEVKSLEWLKGTPAIFVAADSSQVKDIRRYVKTMPNFTKHKLYASGYWKS